MDCVGARREARGVGRQVYEMDTVVEEILDRFGHYRTCSMNDLQQECVTFIRSWDRALLLHAAPDTLVVIAPQGNRFAADAVPALRQVEVFTVEDPEWVFARVHNELNRIREPRYNQISQDAEIHPTAVIGAEGLKVVQDPFGMRLPFKHMGNVRIGAGARVGPGSVVHRACLDSTEIRARAVVGSLCNIGHNVVIDEDAMLTAGVLVGGSARIGRRCFVGMGAVIGNQVRVCDDVMIGMGSVVTKKIDRPGVWYGNPARFVREWDGEWRSN